MIPLKGTSLHQFSAKVALAIHEFTRNVRKDLTKVRSAVEEMEKCGFFNVSRSGVLRRRLSIYLTSNKHGSGQSPVCKGNGFCCFQGHFPLMNVSGRK